MSNKRSRAGASTLASSSTLDEQEQDAGAVSSNVDKTAATAKNIRKVHSNYHHAPTAEEVDPSDITVLIADDFSQLDPEKTFRDFCREIGEDDTIDADASALFAKRKRSGSINLDDYDAASTTAIHDNNVVNTNNTTEETVIPTFSSSSPTFSSASDSNPLLISSDPSIIPMSIDQLGSSTNDDTISVNSSFTFNIACSNNTNKSLITPCDIIPMLFPAATNDCTGMVNNNEEDSKDNNSNLILQQVLPAHDIRRKWPFLLTKVFQTMGVYEKTLKKLSKYLHEDCLYIHNFRGVCNPFSPRRIELHGLHAITNYLDQTALSLPDMVFRNTGAQLYVLPNGHVQVIMKLILKGTKVFKLNHSKFQSIVVDPKLNVSCGSISTTTNSSTAISPTSSNAAVNYSSTSNSNNTSSNSYNNTTNSNSNDSCSYVHACSLPVDESNHTSNDDSASNTNAAMSSSEVPSDLEDITIAMQSVRINEVIAEEPKVCLVGTYTFYTDPSGKCYRLEGYYLM